jgi:hypothetical protein
MLALISTMNGFDIMRSTSSQCDPIFVKPCQRFCFGVDFKTDRFNQGEVLGYDPALSLSGYSQNHFHATHTQPLTLFLGRCYNVLHLFSSLFEAKNMLVIVQLMGRIARLGTKFP